MSTLMDVLSPPEDRSRTGSANVDDRQRFLLPKKALWPSLAWKLGGSAALLLVLTPVFYFLSVRTYVPDSDAATAVLEAQSMAAGHLTLHGWMLSLDSFWSIDALINTLFVVVGGVRSVLLHLVPAFVAALVVLVGIRLASDGLRKAAAIAAGVTVFALLAFPGNYLCYFLLRPVAHVGTTLWSLVAFFCLSRRPDRFGIWWCLGIAFIAAGLLGDFQMVGLALGPVLLAGIARMLRTRSWRRGAPLALGSVGGVVLAVIVRGLSEAVGTFSIGKVQPSATYAQMVKNVHNVVTAGAKMMGVRTSGPGALTAYEFAHALGLAVVVAAFVYFGVVVVVRAVLGRDRESGGPGVRVRRPDYVVDDLLFFGTVGGLAVFVKLASSNDFNLDRYLTSAIIFGCVLGARLVGKVISRFHTAKVLMPAGVIAVASVVCLGFGTQSILAQPELTPPAVGLASFLEAHDLSRGLGDYWSASITTVMSDGAITVRPVVGNPQGSIVRYGRQSADSWYQGQNFQFLVYSTTTQFGVNSVLAKNTFGAPANTYSVGGYVVLTWSHPVTLNPSPSWDPG
jgi:hypothetical protein